MVDENRYVLVFFFSVYVKLVLGADASGAIIGLLVMNNQSNGFSNSCSNY